MSKGNYLSLPARPSLQHDEWWKGWNDVAECDPYESWMSEDFLWLSVIGVIAGGVGISFGPTLKSTTTHVVKLKPVNPEDIQG